jgi:hypothetical protein
LRGLNAASNTEKLLDDIPSTLFYAPKGSHRWQSLKEAADDNTT